MADGKLYRQAKTLRWTMAKREAFLLIKRYFAALTAFDVLFLTAQYFIQYNNNYERKAIIQRGVIEHEQIIYISSNRRMKQLINASYVSLL